MNPTSIEEIEQVTEWLGIPSRALALCKDMENLGLVEQQKFDGLQAFTTAMFIRSRFLVHPLLSVIARDACFGDPDAAHVYNMRSWRRTAFSRYHSTRYLSLFYKQFDGGQQALAEYATGKSLDVEVVRSTALETLGTAVKEFPSLMTTLSIIAEMPEELIQLKLLPNSLTGIISPLEQLCSVRTEFLFPSGLILDKVFRKLVKLLQKDSNLSDRQLVTFTVQQALRIAKMSSDHTELPLYTFYLNFARNLIELHRKTLVVGADLSSRLRLALLETEALEARNLFASGDREKTSKMLNHLLVLPIPQGVLPQLLSLYLHPAFSVWFTTLRTRKHSFPSQHILI